MQSFLELFEERRENAVKSDLQKKLEAEGWEFFTNHRVKSKFGGKLALSTDHELKDWYLKLGFKEVFVTDAYNIRAELILEARAVYVKEFTSQ